MTKTAVLETISFPQKRIKFGGKWFSVDPFLDLDSLKFGNSYDAEFVQDRGGWYISEMKPTEAKV